MQINEVSTFRRLWLLLLVTCATSGVFSQEVKGRVVTQKNLPVEAATVRLLPAGDYAITDARGHFEFPSLTDVRAKFLEVSHIGYRTERVILSDSNDLSSIEIIITESATDLKEVTVTETRILQKIVNNSQSVITVDEAFISKNATGTFSGALAALPGVNTMNLGVGIAKPMIRGMSFNRILVNNRGIKQEGQQWGADHGLEIDPFDVKNVDIIKGPASLLFGSDGLGGVINIKENVPRAENGNTLEYRTQYQSNNGAISNSLELSGRKRTWFYNARITHQDYGDYTVPSDEFTYAGFNLPINDNRLKNTAGSELHFSGSLGYLAENLTSTLRFSSFNQKAGIFTGAIGLPRAYNLQHNGAFRNIDVPRQENGHHTLTSNTTVVLGDNRFEIDLGYQRNIRKELSFPGAHGIAPELANSNLALGLFLDTYTANLRYEINPRAGHQILFGTQTQYMQNRRDGFEFLLPDFDSFQIGFYHYQLWEVSKPLTVNAGLRYDWGRQYIERHLQPIYDRGTQQPTGEFDERTDKFDRQFDNLSGAVGATYQLNLNNLFKLHLGNSFRFPTAIELSSNGVHHGNFRHERGDANLVMERGYQADLTYLRRSKNLSLEISTFYGYYTDYIYLSPTGNFSPLASGGTLWQYQQDDAVFNGFEIAGRYLLPIKLQLDLAVDFVQNLNLNSRLPLPLTPPPSVQFGLEYTLPSLITDIKDTFLFASGRYNFAQNRTDRNERTTPDSFLLHAGLGFSTKLFGQNAEFKLSANNLFNVAYFNHISRYRLLNLPEQGRNISLTAKIPITL